MRHKASHAEVGDRQDSGSQLANRQDLGRIHCRTVGHTQNLPVEESVTTWAFSNKSPQYHRGRRRHRLEPCPSYVAWPAGTATLLSGLLAKVRFVQKSQPWKRGKGPEREETRCRMRRMSSRQKAKCAPEDQVEGRAESRSDWV